MEQIPQIQQIKTIQQIQQHQSNEAISDSLGLANGYAQGETHIIGNTRFTVGTHTHWLDMTILERAVSLI